MIRDRKALIRVALALAFVFLFTAGVHELRKTSAAPDFSCADSSLASKAKTDADIAIEIGAGATGSDIAAQLLKKALLNQQGLSSVWQLEMFVPPRLHQVYI